MVENTDYETKFNKIKEVVELTQQEDKIKADKRYKELYTLNFKEVEANVLQAKKELTEDPKIDEGIYCCFPYKRMINPPKIVKYKCVDVFTTNNGILIKDIKDMIEYWCNIYKLDYRICLYSKIDVDMSFNTYPGDPYYIVKYCIKQDHIII